ncbi:probable ATP-dependent DNA helicase HFM1 isoform X1 [Gallus gallus]|uniref:probable ATP-dependent DNA helicase HFM1 isoform X1 n=1 Tax=Gallus gallus TaxID=9031 RepID=UPI001AEA63C9|nr:probable ATP-dependent DNA helicase HFM1 isoform X1 [Gallus gallus]XP_040533767.1 probable ATP-dependent DNA helicase HFM1 isoform X1 [Gallus gallus]XP_040533768.1 probable ATP-dependent DNA helicase HFM1 isoform X1 [Gallus gallus]XP_040533769.1 probable ATP-dependent DNA helicase HFM1 isoform X1 [Gallus gallus]
MFSSADEVFSLENLFYERPDTKKRDLENNKSNIWWIAPAPAIDEIPPAEELQRELEKNTASSCMGGIKHQKFIQQCKSITEEVNDKSPAPTHFGIASEKEMLRLCVGERTKKHGSLKMASMFLSPDKAKYKIGTEIFQQPDSNFSQTKILINFPENGDDESVHSPFRKSLFKMPDCMYKNTEFKDSSMDMKEVDTHFNTSENVTEVKKDAWRENHQPPVTKDSDFTLHRVNDGDMASKIGIKIKSLSGASKILEMTGTTGRNLEILRAVTEIPTQFRCIFKEFPYFNYAQSKALDDLLYTDRNFVICAPTGSGKTVMFELAITRLLMEVPMPWLNIKVVYMAPIKALCSQRFDDWKEKFGPIGLSCKELTGDTVVDDLFEIHHAHIIITTPEKWDSMTRRWKDNSIVQLVRLFLIDEARKLMILYAFFLLDDERVHVIKDESRGATLEVVVSRMKTVQSSLWRLSENHDVPPLRFVAVSATIPNAEDIAEWLSDGKMPAVCLKVDEDQRPVKLRKIVLGFPCSDSQTEFKFDLTLNYKIASVIQAYSDQKPVLVFCATRKGVQQAASVLSKDAKFLLSVEQKQRLQKSANSLKDSKLRDLLMYGLAYHHAGMEVSDRKIIEGAFTAGDLPVLFTTSTLAMGVNLPAHLVVIKSTMHYVGGVFEEYSETDILQMIGRAGRPQFDTTATAVIMTRLSTREKYIQMLNGADIIESSLHRHLVEHLNAEIALHTVTDVTVALEWIRSTFLYIRALKNPTHYGFSSGLDKIGIEAKLQELCLKNLNDLSSFNLIRMDKENNFKPTETGRLMAWYYIAFDTVKQFFRIKGTETLKELVTMISNCTEFLDVKLRTNEKKILNALNKDKDKVTIRFPMEGRIKTREMKVNCLIQAHLGCIPVQDFTLTQDTGKIFRNGVRVTRWLSDFLASSKDNFSALLNSLILAKCFRCKLWENSLHVSKQLEKIGVSLSNAMVNAGLTSFKKIEDTNARELELILNRHPPFGNQIKESVLHLPKYELNIEQLPKYSDTMAEILVTTILTNFEQLQTRRTASDFHYVTLVVGDADNQVIFIQKIMDSVLLKTGNWMKKIEVKRALKSDDISINLISSDYVGLDIQQTYTAFYLTPRTVGSKVVINKLKAESSLDTSCGTAQNLPAAKVDSGSRSKEENICKKYSNRECNHRCKNKDVCGHDCCKTGVLSKSETSGDSKFSLYLADLRSRNSTSSVPPVKRLKMQMLNQAQNVDLKQFVFEPKSLMPASSRSGNKESFSSPSVVQVDSFNNLGKSQKQFQSWNYGKSDALDMSAELRDDVWDDLDDEVLVVASNLFSRELDEYETLHKYSTSEATSDISEDSCLLQGDTRIQNPVLSVFNSSSKVELSVQSGHINTFTSQENEHSNLSQELEKIQCSSISKIIPDSSKFTRKENFFIFTKEQEEEMEPRYLPDDETSDVKPLLGLLDDIF